MRPRLDGPIQNSFGALAVGLAVLGLSSLRWYTTVGFDFERADGPQVVVTYDRLRWDAGVFWVGTAEQTVPRHGPTLDWWDPGGTLFAPSRPPTSRTLANRLGFWWIATVADDPYEPIRYRGATSSRWVGVPGYLPVALVAWLGLRPNRAWRRKNEVKDGVEKAIM